MALATQALGPEARVPVGLNLFTIPPHLPFLDAIAADWLAFGDDPLTIADGLILLPTRRAARALAEAFLRRTDGRPLLLPRIGALGGLDEAPLALEGALDLPPAVEPMQRLAVLTRLILAMNGAAGAPRSADRAWLLASELASLMDEADRAEIDLKRKLPDAAAPEFAAHWAQTLTFLHIVTDAWPAWLAENGLMNPAARQVALLHAQADAWERAPPPHRVLIAGTTAGIAAVARLLKVAARMPNGRVVLPVLDQDMNEDAWAALDDSHPQAGLSRLLHGLGATRGDVRPWPARPDSVVPVDRFGILSRALAPARTLGSWREPSAMRPDGIARLAAADQQQEAEAIALVLRATLETPGRRAALVTPDRDLAGRVTAALMRFGIVADDSAGEKLADTPNAVFLRLLVRAIADDLAPVALLALLKHPFCAAGLSPAECRSRARQLELAALRGPRPPPGLAGIRRILDRADPDSAVFWARVESCLEPAFRHHASVEAAPAETLMAMVESAERLATTDETEGAQRLWSGEEGEALAVLLTTARAVLPLLPDQRRAVLPGLLDALLGEAMVRSRRASRGRDGGEHPRIFIWGLLEARLQTVETIVLGGLTETVWPPAPEPGPWLSRPMRKTVGLASPEEAVGQAAHDFIAAACAAPDVVLSCPTRRDGAPAVPARWLTRLETWLRGQGAVLPGHPAAAWTRALDQPAGPPVPARPPRPCPAIIHRPSRLSVTEIETWLRDPYAIYARHILKLRALDPLDQATEAADYGTLVHEGLNHFLREHGSRWPPGAQMDLRRSMERALDRAPVRKALAAWWRPRLGRIADWVAEIETKRRADDPPAAIAPELPGTLDLDWPNNRVPGRRFRLVGRADRIERRADGTLSILDYKTGQVPPRKDVEAGLAPQLLLEAVMAAAGGFGDATIGETSELIYWHLTGGQKPGEARALYSGKSADLPAAIRGARESLLRLIDDFDRPDRPYLSRPRPDQGPRFSDYRQLARVDEWTSAGDGEEEES